MNRLLLLQLAAAIGLTVASILAVAAGGRAGEPEVAVGDAHARPSIGAAATAAVYLTLANRGGVADRLIGAATPVAERGELHGHEFVGDIVKMRRLEAVEVGPGQTVELKSGGRHVMLFGLTTPLNEGDAFPLTLHFERAGAVTVEVAVRPLAEVSGTTGGHGSHSTD